jgi:hypothetical protein
MLEFFGERLRWFLNLSIAVKENIDRASLLILPGLADRRNCDTVCTMMGLRPFGGHGAMRGWGHHTKPIPRGFPCPAPL